MFRNKKEIGYSLPPGIENPYGRRMPRRGTEELPSPVKPDQHHQPNTLITSEQIAERIGTLVSKKAVVKESTKVAAPKQPVPTYYSNRLLERPSIIQAAKQLDQEKLTHVRSQLNQLYFDLNHKTR